MSSYKRSKEFLEYHKEDGKKENLPIRFAGLKILLTLAFVVGFFWLNFASYMAWQIGGNGWAGVVALLGYVALFVCWWRLDKTDGAIKKVFPFKWLIAYWRNNVRGHTLWLWAGETSLSPLSSNFQKRGKWPEREGRPETVFAVGLPIGGWFNRVEGFYARPSGFSSLPMKLKIAHGRGLRVTDGDGATMVVPFIEFLLDMQKVVSSLGALSGSIVQWYLWDILSALCARLENVEGHRIRFLRTTIQELDKTKRFIKSDEGMAIKGKLVTELLTLIPEDDPDRQGLGEFLHDLAIKQEKKAAKKVQKAERQAAASDKQ